MSTATKPVMTAYDSRWLEFRQRLEGPEGCSFSESGWWCDSTHRFAKKILKAMGYDVNRSIRYFEQHGGYCDCEILFNVPRGEED